MRQALLWAAIAGFMGFAGFLSLFRAAMPGGGGRDRFIAVVLR